MHAVVNLPTLDGLYIVSMKVLEVVPSTHYIALTANFKACTVIHV